MFINYRGARTAMLSSFVKKLMFARQFDMAEGRISVLGVNQVMLPADLLQYLAEHDPKAFYSFVKQSVKKDITAYAKKIGSDAAGIMNSIGEIFEMFGVGMLHIESIDAKKASASLRVDKSPFAEKSSKPHCLLTAGVLAGMFSFGMEKDVDCKEVKCIAAGASYCQFTLS